MKVLFRVDDGPGIGAGHLMRCFALAESVRRAGGDVYLSTMRSSLLHSAWFNIDATIYIEPRTIGSQLDLNITQSLAKNIKADWLVIDGYSFDESWLNKSENDSHVLYIDDLGEIDPKVSIILNHNPGAEVRYRQSYTQCGKALLGLKFFLIRQAWRDLCYRPEPMRLLITLGGDDQDGRTLKVMNALIEDGRDFVADVVSSAPDDGFFKESELAQSYPERFILHRGPVSLPELMYRASTVICGGGVTSIEAVSIGIFPVIVILAENQKPSAEYLETRNVARTMSILDDSNNLDAAHLALDILSDNRKNNTKSHYVDMQGAFRIVDIMKKGLI